MSIETKSAQLARALEMLALVFVLLAALALSITSLFASARISPVRYDVLQVNLFDENELTVFSLSPLASRYLCSWEKSP